MLKEVLEETHKKFLSLHPVIVYLWITINVLVSLYTAYLYNWQYDYYPFYLWVFIPDCATFGILFAIFLFITLIIRRNNQVVNAVVFIGIIKVITASYLIFILGNFHFDIISLAGYLGLLIEAFFLLPFLYPSPLEIMITTGIHSIDWFFDFFSPVSEFPTLFLYNDPYHPTSTYFNEILVLISVINVLMIIFLILFRDFMLKSDLM
ncbi:MAG: DUF1405 domain-containing protein [Candidatus Heimdallarchaeota archaeon]|nr:MAG: DUF1405 domain-containing protein [Candidatus Heimdallarchaeota archaeon]